MATILHIVDRLTGGGPTRSLIALVKYQARLGLPHRHHVVTLESENYPLALLQARQAGLDVSRKPDGPRLRLAIATADIVQVHFWNNPAYYEFLCSELPPLRCLAWLKVFGRHAPQIITPTLLDRLDFVVATAPGTLALDSLRCMSGAGRAAIVPGIADFDRLARLSRHSVPGFQIGYIGTCNFSKMHPRFVPMHAAIDIDPLQVIVCGTGPLDPLREEAARLGAADRFEFRGYVEDVASVLESLEVFGYPLVEDTYATSEKSLQEAMFAEVPPVVFPHGGIPDLVRHDESGLLVHDEGEYRLAIEYLHRHPDERRRLGAGARRAVVERFAPEKAAAAFNDIYRRMLELPKRPRDRHPAWAASTGAARFIEALGEGATQFPDSWRGSAAADRAIADAPAGLTVGEGGLIQYRNAYPGDPHLHFWTGLVLSRQGRARQAHAEFERAVEAGFDAGRARPYLDGLPAEALHA
jgi:glycosyltransferase involved in cell wall biosynthesis